jgi:hypothetical protein
MALVVNQQFSRRDYPARANSFVVRTDGRLSECTVALDDDKNCVGRAPKESFELRSYRDG